MGEGRRLSHSSLGFSGSRQTVWDYKTAQTVELHCCRAHLYAPHQKLSNDAESSAHICWVLHYVITSCFCSCYRPDSFCFLTAHYTNDIQSLVTHHYANPQSPLQTWKHLFMTHTQGMWETRSLCRRVTVTPLVLISQHWIQSRSRKRLLASVICFY